MLAVRLRPKTLLGAEREVTSDDQGQFTFSGVQPGDYTLVIDKQGFSPQNTRSQRQLAIRV
ncbi:MAG: carboxypeptidase-like regulatory domain-containing protein [Pyrinomonadaceae bacterium]